MSNIQHFTQDLKVKNKSKDARKLMKRSIYYSIPETLLNAIFSVASRPESAKIRMLNSATTPM